PSQRAALTRSSKPTKRGGALLCAISEESHLRVKPQLVSVSRAGGAGGGGAPPRPGSTGGPEAGSPQRADPAAGAQARVAAPPPPRPRPAAATRTHTQQLDSVGTILFEDRHASRIDARQLLSDLFVKLRLDVKDPDRKVRRQLLELSADERRRHVLGDLGERAEAIGEGAFENDRAQTA